MLQKEKKSSIKNSAMLLSLIKNRSSRPEVFLEKGVLKICSKFAREHLYWSAISIKFQRNFIEITYWHGCSPVNLLHIFRNPFLKNTSGWLLLKKEENKTKSKKSCTIWHVIYNKYFTFSKYDDTSKFIKLSSDSKINSLKEFRYE